MTRNEAIFELIKYRRRLEEDPTIIFGRGSFDAEPFDMAVEALERKHGEWIERNVTQDRRDAKIPEWQSAKCSVCGKYHTTPYMYYFTNYNYCPNCGSAMRGNEDE